MKWLRYSARALAVTSASCWTLLIGAFVLATYVGAKDLEFRTSLGKGVEVTPAHWIGFSAFAAILPISLAWVAAVIPWRSDRIGGIVLVLEDLLLTTCCGMGVGIALLDMQPFHGAFAFWVILLFGIGSSEEAALIIIPALALVLMVALLPLVAGVLFLASWRESRTLDAPQATE